MQQARAWAAKLWRWVTVQWNTRLWPWYRSQSRNAQIGIAAGIVVVLVACGALSSVAGGTSTSQIRSTATATRQTASKSTATKPATAKPAAPTHTATPSGPPKVSGPYLGGPETDFETAFGGPTISASETRNFAPNIQGHKVFLDLTIDANASTGRAHFILIKPADQSTWSNATELSIAETFLPPDATSKGDKNVADFGLEHLYQSATLGNSFPPDQGLFEDENGNAVPVGAFYIACNTNVTPDGCTINTGE